MQRIKVINGQWIVEDVIFGDFDFEIFQDADEYRNAQAIELIKFILDENMCIISKKDAKSGRWLSDASYDDEEPDDDDMGIVEYRAKVEEIKNKKYRLPHRPKRYEFYSWKEYETICHFHQWTVCGFVEEWKKVGSICG